MAMDMNQIYNKQISEFLRDHKMRFKQINTQGQYGRVGYSGQLNIPGQQANLMIYLTDKFPFEAPVLVVNPRINNDLIDSTGKVVDDCLRLWGFNSTLSNVVNIILGKIEGRSSFNNQQNNTGNFNQQMNNVNMNMNNLNINQNNNNNNNNNYQNNNNNQNQQQEIENITNELTKDLSNKSIEELIYINFNQEEYINDYTSRLREKNMKLFEEVTEISNEAENLKGEYENVKSEILEFRNKYEESENELHELYNQKQIIEGRFTVDALIEEMRKHIDENYQKPRQKLVSEFNSKQIDFEKFKEDFKDLSTKYHYHNIIKEKLNLYKSDM